MKNIIKISVHDYYKFLLIAESSFKVKIIASTSDYVSMNDLLNKFLTEIDLKDTSYSVNNFVFIKVKTWFEREFTKSVSQNTELEGLIPSNIRKKTINKLLDDLEIVYCNPFSPFKKLSFWNYLLVFQFIIAIIVLYYNFKIGLILIIMLGVSILINPKGNRFNLLTLKDLSDKLSRDNYFNFNENTDSINHNEVKINLICILNELLGKLVTMDTILYIDKRSND